MRGGVVARTPPLYGARVTHPLRPPWPPAPALFLDLDGTLVEIAARPEAVTCTARLEALLTALPVAVGHAVAIVSGRPVADVDRLLAPHRLAVAGIHGLERRSADGKVERASIPLDRATADWLDGARGAMERFVAANPGLRLENKGASLALHYRGRPELESTVRAFVAGLCLPADIECLPGRKVMEIKTKHVNKGAAIRAYLAEPPFLGRTPVFVGDDVTDEAGFFVVNELGGVSVKVGDAPTAANWRLPGVSDVLDWLAEQVAGPAPSNRDAFPMSAGADSR